MSDQNRGWCPVCLRMITLTKDGRLRHHGGAEGTGELGRGRAYRCAGTARWPRPLPNQKTEASR